MPDSNQMLKNSHVIIYDRENNKCLTRTLIVEHNKSDMRIEVPEKLKDVKLGDHINLMIIHPNGVSRYRGIAGGLYNDNREIRLFDEKSRKGRAAERHIVNAPAVVNSIIVDSVQTKLSEPLHVVVENMSSTGTLIKAASANFKVNTILEISISFNGREAIVYGAVIREQIEKSDSVNYGCKFVFFK